ncbi:MAG TPA: ABC transporter ATP-binding protein [Bryobacteraceae bacterium]|nr:ABC transporter ATP-binding protein [Bryobacteraceae bacterium]
MSFVRLEGVSKTYSRKVSRQFLRSFLLSRLRPAAHERFHALREVTLELGEGDSLAVIGPNGAGKSTLLSLIAGLAWPDEGMVKVNGRVAALLELGSGFHPDLTGAENVRLNAALLGFSRRRTREKFDEIVEFSGIGEFIDEPLRTYSAGMTVRLAFSVAAALDPDILLIDEVLAVGDQEFQAKCIRKIMELKRAGRVLVCSSHVMTTLRDLCNLAVWLDHGRVRRMGPAPELLAEYEALVGAAPE